MPRISARSSTRDAARPQQHRQRAGQVEDGELDADRTGAAIEDHRGSGTAGRRCEFCTDMRRCRRADPAGAVGRRGRDRPSGGAQQSLRDRVRRHAHRHRVEPGARQQRHPAGGTARQHQGQRTGPEAPGKPARPVVEHGQRLRLGEAWDMDDQRVEARPAFRGEDVGDGAVVCRVAAESVHGLGRKGDEGAGAQQALPRAGSPARWRGRVRLPRSRIPGRRLNAGRGRAADRRPYGRSGSGRAAPREPSGAAAFLRARGGTAAASSPGRPDRQSRCGRAGPRNC